ncbi:amidase [Pseudorhodoplanes sinuspersici]|uniref:Amidase n=1 Tax=Pseudorhodoplanes sinuspersici TaxID=1235591 RepID=A0A1W6ZQX4_9HYPH|nr:amidase [Pseudorhodoplanes sinuspersici]ARP99781.1 amidase [Pseudorhodoplanes sinuspersici]RKE70777.1 aspartyl-tRNA(Asn)/glutamyl-tRNA(Gln) amidotransferase subunit A [Pseudorhodoplanes sinuspersici]
MLDGPTLKDLARELASGGTTSRALVEECLARATDDAGEGSRVFTHLDSEAARMAADAMDRLRQAGAPLSCYAGIPVSVKDLFDIEGQVTCAGSMVLRDAPPASADATAVARLRRAGFVVIGRTNMTEFAYSGLGINPHYGTPLNPWRRDRGHVPGGSSSGAAISVTDGMAHAALGTDTGGSCRIPAAFTGLVGFKPTARRVSLRGALPLSSHLDSIGPIARTVGCCAIMDSVLSDTPVGPMLSRKIDVLHLAVPVGVALTDLDDEVASAFDAALHRLMAKGVRIDHVPVPEFDEVATINAKGGFTAAESYAWHRRLLSKQRDSYDPRVSIRIERGTEQSAADYIDLLAARASLIERATRRIASYDAIVLPTVALTPPHIADLQSDEAYGRANLLSLRNCTLINMMDGCAISLPVHKQGEAPVGLMLAAAADADRHVLSMAALLEPIVAQRGG